MCSGEIRLRSGPGNGPFPSYTMFGRFPLHVFVQAVGRASREAFPGSYFRSGSDIGPSVVFVHAGAGGLADREICGNGTGRCGLGLVPLPGVRVSCASELSWRHSVGDSERGAPLGRAEIVRRRSRCRFSIFRRRSRFRAEGSLRSAEKICRFFCERLAEMEKMFTFVPVNAVFV